VSYDASKEFVDSQGITQVQLVPRRSILLESSARSHTINELSPFTTYNVNLSAIPADGAYRPPIRITVTTQMAAPQPMVKPDFYGVVSGEEIQVILPQASEEYGPISHYFLIVVPDDPENAYKHPDQFLTDEVIGNSMKPSEFRPYAPYVAAKFPQRNIPYTFHLGNSAAYDGFVNKPLERGKKYRIFVRAVVDTPQKHLYTSSPFSEPLALDMREVPPGEPPRRPNPNVPAETSADVSVNRSLEEAGLLWIIGPVVAAAFLSLCLLSLLLMRRFCQYKAFFAGDLARHEAKRHGAAMPVPQAKKRPMPNLIPLQHASPPPSDADIMAANILSGGHSIFGGPSIIAQSDDEQESFNRKVEFEDEDMEEEETPETLDKMDVKVEHEEPQELKCNLCGHDSKTINEALNHQKTHKNEEAAQRSFLEGVGLSSTRCQHCGVRCKNSAELMVHLRKCTSKARGSDAGALDSGADNQKSSDDHSDEEIVGLQCASCRQPFEEFEELRNHIENCKARMMELTPEVSITEIKGAEFMPVVAKNFNWNHDKSPQRSASKEIKPALTIERVSAQNLNSEEEDKIDTDEDDMEPRKLTLGEVFVGIETAPGYGCVTEEKVPNPHESQIQFTKVYKCPQCNFWASAASRFHIHFVGHLNSKPFGCSQCNYRSNWRWDVAKHIRLKGARDPKHAPGARPRVLVTDDDTSRRNYSKYAKYIMYLLVQPGPDMEGLPNSVSSRISPNSVKQQMPVLQSQVPSRPTVSRTPTESAMQQFERSMQPETSQAKQPNRLLQNKKLVWRCKKCNHRGMNKEEVLDHVRSHYTNPKQQQQHEPVTAKKFSCEKCPFTGKMNEVQLHKSHHQPQPGANFKCYICPFFVSNKKELYTHMSVHGVSDPEEFMNKMQSGTFSLSVASAPSQKETKPPKVPDTSNMKEVPLFWVTKGGKFMKKFKCRHCPHNNSRKVNIVEHEKMHTNRQVWGATDYSNVYHTCTHCNYTCNNAGVLSAHFKVHQDSYPKALTLVDPSRPDIDQVRELGGNEHSLDNQGSLDSREGSPAAQSENDNGDVNSPSGVQVNPEKMESDEQLVYFCSQCPGRFMFTRELAIHKRFHRVKLQFHCSHCNYTARQPQHLAAHNKVHCSEYQDRTALLLMNHQESMDHPKPALIVRDDIWVVNELDDLGDMPILKHQHQVAQPQQQQETSPGQSQARQHCCHLCPARFFKAVALQYHVSLHGGNGPYKCSKCDYAVKMYGNLVRHEVVHDEKENEDLRDDPPNIVPATVQMASPPPVISRPMPQLQPQVPQPQPQVPQLQPQVPHISLPADPVFGTLMHGSPEFIYPTYMKNGKLKEKRYKCHKCPSAFEKREQYKVHLSLHGSKQKYKCERCDYSVKYYANFIQHTKKHDINDQAQQQKLQEQQQQMQEQYESQKPPELMDLGADEDDLDDETLKVLHEPEVVLVTKPNAGSLGSVQRQQQMMMLERRKQHQQSEIPTTPEMAVATTPTFWCSNCPYCNQRRDQVEQHLRLHQRQSDMKYACCYCDLANATQQDMQEHMLLHFRARKMPNSRRAVTFTSYDDMEIRASKLDQPDDEEEEEGAEGRLVVRKLSEAQPQPENSNDEDEQDCQFIDLRTGNAVPYEQEMLARKEQAAQLL
ncbi:Hypothetical predicted protein, partial [Cloeon dipterum]